LVLEGCRAHRLSEDQAAELLGLNHYELDGFLERHAVFLDYSIEDDERETRNEVNASGRSAKPNSMPRAIHRNK